jgi:hypothetical protein
MSDDSHNRSSLLVEEELEQSNSEERSVKNPYFPSRGNLEEYATNTAKAMDELAKLAGSDYAVEEGRTKNFISNQLGLGASSGQSLEQRIYSFQRSQVEEMSTYAKSYQRKKEDSDHMITFLHGFSRNEQRGEVRSSWKYPLKTESSSGGYFLRWNGQGVVINPGRNFMQNFHESGLHIRDIDHIIVTGKSESSYADIYSIYDLNYHFNKIGSDLHIIHYYMNQQAHREIAPRLKPHFKQERNSVHPLELYVDSPDIETLSLGSGIILNYFPTAPGEVQNSIGLRLELQKIDATGEARTDTKPFTIGYISNAPYSSVLAHHLNGTDLLIAGFGKTSQRDYEKEKYNENSLGYFGSYSLMNEVGPSMMVVSEFSGSEGDIRMEAVKRLRQEYAYSAHHNTVVFPGDVGMAIDLEYRRVRCSVTGTMVEPAQVHISKTQDSFGRFSYLSPGSII